MYSRFMDMYVRNLPSEVLTALLKETGDCWFALWQDLFNLAWEIALVDWLAESAENIAKKIRILDLLFKTGMCKKAQTEKNFHWIPQNVIWKHD
jgi:hypothetical protein